MKVYQSEWTTLEMVDGHVVDSVYEFSPFMLREIIIVKPDGTRSSFKMNAAYR